MWISVFVIVLALVLFAVVAFVLVPHAKHLETRCAHLVSQLPRDQLESIEPFAEALETIRTKDKDFQLASGGLPGALKRIHSTDLYLQLVWITYSNHLLDLADARYVWSWALLQFLATLLAIPEAALCSALDFLPHVFSYLSFDAHRRVVLRCEVALAHPNAPKCVGTIKDLL